LSEYTLRKVLEAWPSLAYDDFLTYLVNIPLPIANVVCEFVFTLIKAPKSPASLISYALDKFGAVKFCDFACAIKSRFTKGDTTTTLFSLNELKDIVEGMRLMESRDFNSFC